jgi:hypothetical protein
MSKEELKIMLKEVTGANFNVFYSTFPEITERNYGKN